ncbi:helix-turn-helix domain-containing protein [Nocardioides sp. NPDC047086]|uniref:helix-turn-helix domain-containing protein n=1 Tax=Nocardioides sp. NPDC047086 TaxID=3154810 RepID=UPI0033E76796
MSTNTTTDETTSEVPFSRRDDEEVLTLTEVALILKTPVNTLRWWRRQGIGPTYFKLGRRLMTTVGDLRQFMREQRLNSRRLI